jgi:SSS family solute:Na+ symporter
MDQTLGTGIDYAVIVLYFTAILGFGALFGRYARSTQDFFFAGQRFPWWLIAVSLVATLVGSYSFIKYSKKAYEYGFSSSYAYLNDPGWTPLFILVWLPLIYYARIASVPEYMERRFGTSARLAATFIMLVYMVGYIGFNLYTIGVGMQGMLGMDPLLAAVLVGIVCAVYVTAGGQTSVVMTDLIQGFILLLAGVGLLVLGIAAVGGFDEFWRLLGPVNGLAEQRRALPPFNSPRDFNFVGIFWQDGMANNLAALLINQGMIMRFLAARSVRHGQKAAVAMAVVLVPVAAIAVSGGGWIGSAMTRAGLLNDADSAQIFVVVADTLCGPGLFGLMMAALIAALMSTADTLINATAHGGGCGQRRVAALRAARTARPLLSHRGSVCLHCRGIVGYRYGAPLHAVRSLRSAWSLYGLRDAALGGGLAHRPLLAAGRQEVCHGGIAGRLLLRGDACQSGCRRRRRAQQLHAGRFRSGRFHGLWLGGWLAKQGTHGGAT